MHRPKLVLTRALPPAWIRSLHGHVQLVCGPAEPGGWTPALRAALPDAEALICFLTEPVDRAILQQAPRLSVVSNVAVGVDNIDLDACRERNIAVGHTPGVLTDATADLTFGLLLTAARELRPAAQHVRAGQWKTWSPTGFLGLQLRGATLGILGLGKIGRAVAHRAEAFGMSILFHTRSPPRDVPSSWRGCALDELLASSDVLSLHCPLTDATRGLLDADALGQMPDHAILVNTARGPIVDTEALVAALDAGRLRAAALDVTDPEPISAEHPLMHHPRAFITPHIGSATESTRQRMAELACANALAALRGQPLPHALPPDRA